MENKTIAYCGYDCKRCPVFLATQNNDLELLKQIVITPGVSIQNQTVEEMGCFGCCDKKTVNYMCKGCPIRICASQKDIENSGWCDNFPCEKLNFISEKTMDFLKSINNKKNLK
jgi:hypothetical protein